MDPWMMLGTMILELADGPEDLAATFAQDYSEHASIGGKPRLQWVGERLRELRFRVTFRHQLGDPETRLKALLAAASAHKPLSVVMGTGEYGAPWAGQYVITELPATLRQQADNGRPLVVEVDLVLREWIPDEVLVLKSTGKALGTSKGKVATKTGSTAVEFKAYSAAGYDMPVPKTVTRQPLKVK